MATKVNVVLSGSQTELVLKTLAAAPKQTNPLIALTEKTQAAKYAAGEGAKKIEAVLSGSQAALLIKTIAAAPKQTKPLEAVIAKVQAAVDATPAA